MKRHRILLCVTMVVLVSMVAGLTASSAQTNVELGEPGLSYRYTHTLGVTDIAYFEDSEHINFPWGIGSDGVNIWVPEAWGGRALKFASDGTFLMQIGTAGQGAIEDLAFIKDTAVDADGNVWLVDSNLHHINKYDVAGAFLLELGQVGDCSSATDRFCIPSGIDFGPGGTVFVSDEGNARIQILDSNGVYLGTLGETGTPGQGDYQFNAPEHLAIYGTELYVADSENQRVEIFDISLPFMPIFLARLGETGVPGDDNDHFACPNGVSINATYIYIADACNNRIQVFDRVARTYVATIGSGPGQGNDQFDLPTDVVVDAAGNVYVADYYNVRIQQFNPAWEYLRTYGTTRVPYLTDGYHYNQPSGVAVDSQGNTFITETRGMRLIKLDSSGTFQWAVGEPGMGGSDDSHFGGSSFVGPLGVAADGSGGAFVADSLNHRVLKCSSAGTCNLFAGVTGEAGSDDTHFNIPLGVAADAEGNVYVGDTWNQRVQKCSPAGVCATFAGVTGEPGNDNGHFNTPTGVGVDTDGNVYVADTANQRIQKFDSAGAWQMQLGITEETGSDFGHFADPRDVAVDNLGRILVSDGGNNRVEVFDSAGAYLTTIAGSVGSETGELRYTPGVDFDTQGNIYIADEQNHRVQVFAAGVPNWKQVNINGFGDPLNSGVTSVEVFGGQLYAGVENFTDGATVWRTADGHSWDMVSEPGFTSTYTTTNRAVLDMFVFNDQLYAGAGWGSITGQVWRSADGTTWQPVTLDGFGDPGNISITNFASFGGMLYAGTQNYSGAQIWLSETGDQGSWVQVASGGLGTPAASNVNSLLEFKGLLYAAVQTGMNGPIQVWRSDATGINWSVVVPDGFGDPGNGDTSGLAQFGGYLYLGTQNNETGAQIWRSEDGDIWTQVMGDGFGDLANIKVESLYVFKNELFAVTENLSSGMQVWNSRDGLTWNQINLDGFGDSNNFATLWSDGTIAWKGQYYLGTTNLASGGEIWQYARFLYLPVMMH